MSGPDETQGPEPAQTWSGGQSAPAHPRQHPDFGPGNEVALKSGAWSPRVVDPVAAALVVAAQSDPGVPYLQEPRYGPALHAWAKAEARVLLLETWVSGMTIERAAESSQGRTPPLEILRKWEAAASSHRDKLGLTPLSASRLGRNVAVTRQVDAAAVMAQLHAMEQRGESL